MAEIGSLTLVTGTEQTRQTLLKQLKEYITEDIDIKSFAVDEGINEKIKDDLIILSSDILYKELIENNQLCSECEVITAKRTINYDAIEEIMFLDPDTDVLFVNDIEETAKAGIEALKELQIDHINLYPYYPGMQSDIKKAKVAITPGEVNKVPEFVEDVYNIGPRIIDFTTILKLLNRLDIVEHKAGQFSRSYLNKIINIAKKFAQSANEVSNLNEHLGTVINSLNDALVVYDNKGYISVTNANFNELFNLNNNNFKNKCIRDLVYSKKLLSFLMSDKKDKKVFEIKNKNYVVSKFSLPESEFYTAVFKSEKDTIDDNKRINQEFINKGFVAKYNFEDIIGESQANRKVKKVAKKLAKTDLTILIEGESGTGKELFANAIHNSSKRKNGPFLAVNFSALPDKLIESELFGYEPGAFTGAKKSGKKGLFEQADGGSIFLDEIGDISIEVQARLLRVLQEKELMRIGGNKINKVDVRVIAATNKNLWNLIEQGKFRKDLYYRLKIGYLKLPPLRERKEDLKELMDYFIEVESTKPIKIAQEVFEELKKYDWYGNIRELKNTLNYMLAVREGDKITLSDIPNQDFFKGEIVIEKDRFNQNLKLSEEEKFLIKMIDQLKQKHNVIGRRLLAEKSQNTSFPLTKYQIRNRLDKLEKKGLVKKGKGKKGTQLTILGKEYLDQ